MVWVKEIARLAEKELYGVQQPYLMPPDAPDDMGKWVDCNVKRVEREGRRAPVKPVMGAAEPGGGI